MIDEHTVLALRTWYPKDDDRHLDFAPAVLGIAGEAGEILDQYKKHLFKKNRRCTREKFLDELGDLWYYLRIRAYQIKHELSWKPFRGANTTISIIAAMNSVAANITEYHFLPTASCNIVKSHSEEYALDVLYGLLTLRCREIDCTIDELTKLNYEKLFGGKHGWEEHKNDEN